jgi:hypothetical protein
MKEANRQEEKVRMGMGISLLSKTLPLEFITKTQRRKDRTRHHDLLAKRTSKSIGKKIFVLFPIFFRRPLNNYAMMPLAVFATSAPLRLCDESRQKGV